MTCKSHTTIHGKNSLVKAVLMYNINSRHGQESKKKHKDFPTLKYMFFLKRDETVNTPVYILSSSFLVRSFL